MVNGITGGQTAVDTQYSQVSKQIKDTTKEADAGAYSKESAVYEKSDSLDEIASMSKSDRTSLVEQMKKEADAQTEQLRQLVQKMLLKQGDASSITGSMWEKMASDGLLSDQEAIDKATSDVSEDGYWGVSQTSDRIMSFAVALSGGDEEKMHDMLKAVEKGFRQATGSWGKELPQLCQDTYSAVQEKFSSWFKEHNTATE